MNNGQRLAGKAVLITGGTSGIGEATVELFAAQGANVVFTGRDASKGDAIQQRAGSNTRFFRADVMKEDDIQASINQTIEHFGRIDVLFNNAGNASVDAVESVTVDSLRHAFDLLVGSVALGMKHAAPHMKAQGWGRIINNASVAALRADMGGYLYSGAKAAVTQLTRLAGKELGPFGITANAISPGAIATPVFYGGSQRARTLDADSNQAKMAKLNRNLAKCNPVGRAGQPDDIAYAALFLASDEASFINCHDLVVDGGMTVAPKEDYQSSRAH